MVRLECWDLTEMVVYSIKTLLTSSVLCVQNLALPVLGQTSNIFFMCMTVTSEESKRSEVRLALVITGMLHRNAKAAKHGLDQQLEPGSTGELVIWLRQCRGRRPEQELRLTVTKRQTKSNPSSFMITNRDPYQVVAGMEQKPPFLQSPAESGWRQSRVLFYIIKI